MFGPKDATSTCRRAPLFDSERFKHQFVSTWFYYMEDNSVLAMKLLEG
jgi:hypothetical protein